MWETRRERIWQEIANHPSGSDFERIALQLFHLQAVYNPVYAQFLEHLRVAPPQVHSVEEIPYLPVELFRSHRVQTGNYEPELVFSSSSTSSSTPSVHLVRDGALYKHAFTRGFRQFYGSPEDWCVIGLLPSYLEREGSSLIFMVNELIRLSGHEKSGFYLHNQEELARTLLDNEEQGVRTLLIGVTFALLDFAECFPCPLRHTTIMETGGMKGRREEMTREEVHLNLRAAFQLEGEVHSEYGMTELMSQAYSTGDGRFRCPPWMKVLIRESTDPLEVKHAPARGGINVIDLMNLDSCAFLATGDIGRTFDDGSFTVEGRFDRADVRGCNLMVL